MQAGWLHPMGAPQEAEASDGWGQAVAKALHKALVGGFQKFLKKQLHPACGFRNISTRNAGC